MPVNKLFIGTYDVVFLGGNAIIVEKASRNRTMRADGEKLVQGTVNQRVLNIGPVSEEFSIDGPILIGGGQAIDVRNLMRVYIQKMLTPQPDVNNLADPVLLTNARINIGQEGGSISLSFKSDGNPNNTSFLLYGGGADNLPNAPLDPGTQKPTRKSAFYDFRVNLAGYKMFIIDCDLNVTVEVEEKYFIAGNDNSSQSSVQTPGGGASDNPPWNPTNNPNNWNTQFPWLFITAIKLDGGGSAAVKKLTKNTTAYGINEFWDSAVNVALNPSEYELTLQAPGQVVTANDDFAIQVFQIDYANNPSATTGSWVNLFRAPDGNSDLMDLSKAVITSANFNETPGLLTVAFKFVCWVR